MERIDLGDAGRADSIAEALARGEEVILVQDGRDVAQAKPIAPKPGGLDLEKLMALHEKLGPMAGGDAIGLVREMRDADDH